MNENENNLEKDSEQSLEPILLKDPRLVLNQLKASQAVKIVNLIQEGHVSIGCFNIYEKENIEIVITEMPTDGIIYTLAQVLDKFKGYEKYYWKSNVTLCLEFKDNTNGIIIGNSWTIFMFEDTIHVTGRLN